MCFSCRSPFHLPSLLPLFRLAFKLLMDLIQDCSRSFLITKSCHMRILLRGEKALTSSSSAKLHSVLEFSLGMVTFPKSNCFTIRTSAACSLLFSYLAVQRPLDTKQTNNVHPNNYITKTSNETNCLFLQVQIKEAKLIVSLEIIPLHGNYFSSINIRC